MRRALVTGASSGIGEATARLLGERGWRVAMLARRGDRLERLARELPPSTGGAHLALACDLCRPEEIRACFERVAAEFGGLELLVNNAGIGYRARVAELDPEHLRQVLDTNIAAVLLCSQAALPLLRKGERPAVVNVASVVGRRGMPTMAAYAASKAAVCSIGESLRLEWSGHGISVCTLNPGVTATEIFEKQRNPSRLHDPDLATADLPRSVAKHVLALYERPEPERFLRWKWRWLGALSLVAPRLADRVLASRGWIPRSPTEG